MRIRLTLPGLLALLVAPLPATATAADEQVTTVEPAVVVSQDTAGKPAVGEKEPDCE